MNIAKIIHNDVFNGEDICVSLWVQGCPHHCTGCHNPETWSFEGGYEAPSDIKGRIIKAISANGITRNFSILGGEPLCEENTSFVDEIVTAVRTAYPQIKIYIWSGYTFNELKALRLVDPHISHILDRCDVLIDGRYEDDKRDITLPLRGSSNQQIIDLKENL